MLPIVNTLAAGKRLWDSMTDEQKSHVENMVIHQLPQFLGQFGYSAELIQLLSAQEPLGNKVARIASNPKVLQRQETQEDVLVDAALMCPHCERTFIKDLSNGQSSNS